VRCADALSHDVSVLCVCRVLLASSNRFSGTIPQSLLTLSLLRCVRVCVVLTSAPNVKRHDSRRAVLAAWRHCCGGTCDVCGDSEVSFSSNKLTGTIPSVEADVVCCQKFEYVLLCCLDCRSHATLLHSARRRQRDVVHLHLP
jgi:hypothetical protein